MCRIEMLNKKRMYYGEFILEDSVPSMFDFNGSKVGMQNRRLLEMINKTITKWKQYLDFDYLGIVCGKNIEVSMEALDIIRKAYKGSTLIVIINKVELVKKEILEHLMLFSPSRLCVILPEAWAKDVLYIQEILKSMGIRFLRVGNEPIGGIRFLIVNKDCHFIIDMYQHIKCNPLTKREGVTFLTKIGATVLFEEGNQKYMPVLDSGIIFKCRNAFRLWKYWEEKKAQIFLNMINPDIQVLEMEYKSLIKDSLIYDTGDVGRLRQFGEYSKICSLCSGCIECIVFPKEKGSQN